MNRRSFIEIITALILVLCGSVMVILPLFNVFNIKAVFISIMVIYGLIHFIKSFAIILSKDYSGFLTAIASIVVLLIMLFLDINDSPWNLALILFIWIILMSLIKLKESDYYHDKENKLWKLNILNLLLFILSGILTAINLYYPSDIQILVLGFFFLINGILELMDPLVAFIIEKK